ncbi:MAG: histidine phosphatase family protein [Marmoricola sp.]
MSVPTPSSPRSIRIEADGGSRGNPGPSAYGAVRERAATGEVIAGKRDAGGLIADPASVEQRAAAPVSEPVSEPVSGAGAGLRGWSGDGTPTTLILVRHGVTDHTTSKKFSGGLASSNPGLNDEGRAQVRATAEWLAPLADGIDALVSSPVRRTRESAEILAAVLGHDVEIEDGIAEMEFGSWDGLTFTEVHEKYPDEMQAWLGSLDAAPGGGESFRVVAERVLQGRDRLLASYAGKTVVAVSHVTPIKTLVADTLGAPLEALYRMELSPASVTVVSYYEASPEGRPKMSSLRLFNARPTEVPFISG